MTSLVADDFFGYYVKGRLFEWTFAIAMMGAGLECLIWDKVVSFGAFHWLLSIMSQKWIGTVLLFTGWIRVSSLIFNGNVMFGFRFGLMVRGACAVLCATLWFQFAFALLQISLEQGFPSIGLPFWTMFVVAELVVSYSVGLEWKR